MPQQASFSFNPSPAMLPIKWSITRRCFDPTQADLEMVERCLRSVSKSFANQLGCHFGPVIRVPSELAAKRWVDEEKGTGVVL
jgi:hypothetical protein